MGHILNKLVRGVPLAIGLLLGACVSEAPPEEAPGAIAIYGNNTTFEISPVLLAARDFYPDDATVKMGGIPNLVGEPIIPGFGEEGVADVATHAETQALRYSVDHPNLRIILNVSQGLYRVVARRSDGIESVADLKGKKIAVIPQTSAGFFLRKMLEREGLTYDDIEALSIVPLNDMVVALDEKRVSAVVIWEPYSENAARVLGDDIVEFSGEGVYRELFNLNTTAENLADPVQRRKIVRFVRSIIDAAESLRADPTAAQALLHEVAGFPELEISESWKHHAFPASFPGDLLDVLVEEEAWLSARDERPQRSREEIGKLIDKSILEEALALEVSE